MTWKVSVRYTDEKHTRGVIDSIGHPTSRLEATIENDKYAGVFTWKKKKMPTIGEDVVIDGKLAVPAREPTLFARLNSVKVRQEIDQAKAENVALRQRVDQLHRISQRVRQNHPVRRMIDGKVVSIDARENKSTARNEMVKDFTKSAEVSLYEKIILVRDANEAHRINIMAQEGTKSIEPARDRFGLVHNDCVFHTGDRVQCFADHETLRDGDLAHVVAIDRETKTVSLFLDRHECPSNLTHVCLSEYPSIGLGYATTFERAHRLSLNQACILAEPNNGAAELVRSINCEQVRIYTDRLTAEMQFSPLLREMTMPYGNDIDRTADPIAQHFRERS